MTVQFGLNVLVLASMYALLAAGYVLIYRASRVVNLAHGELMMLAAYLLWALTGLLRGQPLVVVLLALLASAALGVAL